MACEYCEKLEPLISVYGARVIVDGFRETLNFAHYDQIWAFESCEINYCPMCGERLGDADERA